MKLPWNDGEPWHNVWIGMTAENQKYADIRLPYLTQVNAVVRFVSAEPLLGSIDISQYASGIDWMIFGGESGGNARAMELGWSRSLRDQCISHRIPFHFKQWGNYVPLTQIGQIVRTPKNVTIISGEPTVRLSKKNAGGIVDGNEWKESPAPRAGSIPALSEKAA